MPSKCPLCGQPLPHAINEHELTLRLQKLASPTLAVEKRKLKEEFERQYRKHLQVAEERAMRAARSDMKAQLLLAEKRVKDAEAQRRLEVERARKDVENRLRKEQALSIQLAKRENEDKLRKLQLERERDRVRHEEESVRFQGKLDELSRKLEKRSGEQLGAEAERDLLSDLRQAFSGDRIERIGRGVKGADILHEVRDNTKVVGRIVYESKNTLTWQNDFIVQAKKYQTQYETPHVMVVTRVFPSKRKGLCVEKGIPVVETRLAVSLASVIRDGVIEIAKLRLSGKSSDGKSQELYEYIIGDKFCTRFQDMAQCVATLRERQQKERTWHENAWETTSKIHERIAGRHREVEAQISAIVRGASGSEGPKLPARADNWAVVSGIRQIERTR